MVSLVPSQQRQDAPLSQGDRATGCVIVFAKSRRLELEDNILCDIIGLKSVEFGEKRKIRAITAFKVIQGHRGRYQSKARMRFPISN